MLSCHVCELAYLSMVHVVKDEVQHRHLGCVLHRERTRAFPLPNPRMTDFLRIQILPPLQSHMQLLIGWVQADAPMVDSTCPLGTTGTLHSVRLIVWKTVWCLGKAMIFELVALAAQQLSAVQMAQTLRPRPRALQARTLRNGHSQCHCTDSMSGHHPEVKCMNLPVW